MTTVTETRIECALCWAPPRWQTPSGKLLCSHCLKQVFAFGFRLEAMPKRFDPPTEPKDRPDLEDR